EQLLDNLRRFPHLLQADPVAGKGVTVGMGPDLPVDVLPGQGGWLVSTEVKVDTRCPGIGARQPVLEGDVWRDDADAASPLLEDLVAHEQRFDLVAETPDLLHDGLCLVDPPLWKVLLEPADAVIVRVEAAS